MTVPTPDHFLSTRRGVVLGAVSLASMPVLSQFRVEISGVGMTQLPIAVAVFRGEETLAQKISGIVQSGLERSGQFRAIDAGGLVMDEATRPDTTVWRQKGADSLVTGSVNRLADGRLDRKS